MKLAAMLAWFDEPPKLLYSCVQNAAPFITDLVALDGSYILTPGAAARSADDQWDALRDACVDHHVRGHIASEWIWDGQVAKRGELLRRALKLQPDFVMPLDADWRLGGDPDVFPRELEAHPDADRFGVQFRTPTEPDHDIDRLSPSDWHRDMAGTVTPLSLVYRPLDDMKIEGRHWWYSGIDRTGRRVALWGDDQPPGCPAAAGHMIPADVFNIQHLVFYRDRLRLDRNRDYIAARDDEVERTGAET